MGWWPYKPDAAPPGFGKGQTIPESDSFILSQAFFSWLDPLLKVGFSRPLQQDDLWEMPFDRLTASMTDQVETAFFTRCPPDQRPRTHQTSDTDLKDDERTSTSPNYDTSITKTLHSVFYKTWWRGGAFHLCGDTLKTTTPLVMQVFLTWLAESYAFYTIPEEQRAAAGITHAPRGGGYGVGLAFAIFAMQQTASLFENQQTKTCMTVGLWARASIIGTVFRKSLRLSGKARSEHSTGEIMTLISTDATRIDHFATYGHHLWVAPIQVIIGIALLIKLLGYSALVGLGVIILGIPVQGLCAMVIMKQREKGVKITDSRVRLTTEVLQGVRLLKYYAWEDFYIHQISDMRRRELKTIRTAAMAESALFSIVYFIPLIASILSFITYSLTGHKLSVATIFTSLQFFNIIKGPMVVIPFVLYYLSEYIIATRRLRSFLTAEEQPDPPKIDYKCEDAIRVENGNFTWDAVIGEKEKADEKDKMKKKKENKMKKATEKSELPVTAPACEEKAASKQEPFQLRNINMTVPKGGFVVIIGQVGSGKSSILNALLGEMKKTSGDIVFGGSAAYVSQAPWIKNASVRDNITGGGDVDEDRLDKVVEACNLVHDIRSLPDGLDTNIGEKGINLSGGQKARVSLARAAYASSDIVLLDDPLSAVDAYVGKKILENCILSGPFKDRTRIMVTHALHVLDKADYIYLLDDGVIKEEGTYKDLLLTGPNFSKLVNDFQSKPGATTGITKNDGHKTEGTNKRTNEAATALMQEEERNVGAVPTETYTQYLQHAGGIIWAPIVAIILLLEQLAEVGNNVVLGLWTSSGLQGFDDGRYMALYAGLGVGQVIFTFIFGYTIAIITIKASYSMFRGALRSVLKSPVAFFDTTPMGRILSRLSKDQDVLDNELNASLQQLFFIIIGILGTMGLVFYTVPLVGVMFAPTAVLYYFISTYYRRTSIEVKRLDPLSRSAFYSSYSETLTGLTTVRAYRGEPKALEDAQRKLDCENQAYYLTVTLQRWLSIRLDFFSNILLLGIALAAASNRRTLNPAKIGVVLTYAVSVAEFFSQLVTTFAQTEQNMNAVERLLAYTTLSPEKDDLKTSDPPTSWPSNGQISFKNVEFAYREGLPLVLKGVSFEIRGGEKIGIVGRTGAGKSSVIQALFRITQVRGGSIEIDGVDINALSLQSLRSGLALVPQDSVLFLGTLRENLDPLHTRTDAELISAMRRSSLLPSESNPDEKGDSKFNLDSTVGDEGSNFSAGEKQLIALCRALVRRSRVLVLDEATSNVDVETDAKLQQAIQNEFGESTIICVAHRLNTIAHYDRILVMDDGKVAEFDGVLQLFDERGSIFRSLCDEANLGREDILRIRAAHGQAI